MIVCIFLVGIVAAEDTGIKPETYSQIVLESMLQDDKPVSYCVDIPGCCGVGEVKTSSNMMMHTCKIPTGNSNWQLDEIWDFDQPSKGMVQWRASKGMCLQASISGSSGAVKLSKCDTGDQNQYFVYKADNTIRMQGAQSLCWTVATSYRKSRVNANNHMRKLSVVRCDATEASRKQFLVPPGALAAGEFCPKDLWSLHSTCHCTSICIDASNANILPGPQFVSKDGCMLRKCVCMGAFCINIFTV